MLDVVAEEIASCAVRLLWWFVPPLEVEVKSLFYQSEGAGLRDGPTVPTVGSKRYCAELLLSNRRGTGVSVEGIAFSVNNRNRYELHGDATKIQLDAHEVRRQHIVFPISSNDIPDQEGRFKLTVTPTGGRPTTVAGDFPISSEPLAVP